MPVELVVVCRRPFSGMAHRDRQYGFRVSGTARHRPTAAFSLRPPRPTRFAGVPAARAQAAAALGAGGILVLAGLTPESIVVHDGTGFSRRGNQIRGHRGSGFEHVELLIGLACVGRIDLAPSVAARLPLAEAADAVTRLEKKIGGPIRFVLTP